MSDLFDPARHPRGLTGQFTETSRADPGGHVVDQPSPAEIIGTELDRLIAEHTQEGVGFLSDHWRGHDFNDGRDAGIEFAVEQIRNVLGRVFPGQSVGTAPGECATCGYTPDMKVYSDGTAAECPRCGAREGIRVFG